MNRYVQFVQAMHNVAMEEIRQVGVRSRIIANMSNDISNTMRSSYEETQRTYDRISEARSQTTRGLTPYDAGDGQKVILPSEYNFAWHGNDGQYILSNDPNYDPNSDSTTHTAWQKMQQAR